MRTLQWAGLLLLSATFALCMTAQAVEQATQPTTATSAQQPCVQLRQLLDEFFLQDLALNLLYAPAREVNDLNNRFGDYLSDEYLRAQKALESNYLAQGLAVDRSQLSQADKVTYDAFIYTRQTVLQAYELPF